MNKYMEETLSIRDKNQLQDHLYQEWVELLNKAAALQLKLVIVTSGVWELEVDREIDSQDMAIAQDMSLKIKALLKNATFNK